MLAYGKLQSTDKPTFKKAISQNAQIIVKQSMFALAKRGAGAKPLQKKHCHPEARPQNDIVIYEGGCAPFTPA